MQDYDAFLLSSQSMGMAFFSIVLYAVNSLFLLLYQLSSLPYVPVFHYVVSFSMVLVGISQWVIITALQINNAGDYRVSQCLNAYCVFLVSMTISTVGVQVDCLSSDSVICVHMHPFSAPAVIESSINSGLMVLLCVNCITFASSCRWNRRYFVQSFLWGGLIIAVVASLIFVLLSHAIPAFSCPKDIALDARVNPAGNMACVAVLVAALVALIVPFIIKYDLTLDMMNSSDMRIELVIVFIICSACNLFIMFWAMGEKQIRGANVWIFLIAMSLGISCPVIQKIRNVRSAGTQNKQMPYYNKYK